MTLLYYLIFIDIVSGICKAVYNKELNSTIGIRGLSKHLCILVAFSLAIYVPDIKNNPLFTTGTYAYSLMYAISISENLSTMGIFPKQLAIYLDKYKSEEK